MDKYIRAAVIVSVLLAGVAVFYHFVIFLPKLEHSKALAMERKVAEDQKREQFRNKVYIACKSIARENYHANWDHACAVQLKACLVGTKEGSVGAQICRNNWGSPDCKSTVDTSLWSLKDWDSCMLSKSLEASGCSLPKHAAESVNSRYKQEQERCAAEARLGVQ